MSSSSLSFGPTWMRPKPSKGASNDSFNIPESNSDKATALPAKDVSLLSNRINKVYSIDELLRIWQKIQETIEKKGLESRYTSLDPIRQLVQQVRIDRSIQSQQNRVKKRDNPDVLKELTEQLNNIDNWSAEEQQALDITSIIKNAQQSQSPLNSNTSLLSSSNMDRAFTTGHAPLFNSKPQPYLLQPQQVKWNYLDPQGIQQGPFDGAMMDSWHQSGYLNDDLQLKREEEFTFYTLKELKASLGSPTPFAVPLQPVTVPPLSATALDAAQPSSQHTSQFSTPPLQHTASASNFQFNSWSSSTFIQPQTQPLPQVPVQVQQPQPQQTWNSLAPTSGRSSPWVQQPQLSQDFGLRTQSPFLSNSLLNQNLSQNLYVSQDELFSNIQSQVSQVLSEPVREAQESVISGTDNIENNIEEPVNEVKKKVKEDAKEEKKLKEKKKEILKKTKDTKIKPSELEKEQKQENQEEPTREAKGFTPALAPWASKTSVPETPKLTLDQIQKLEAEENKKQLKLKAEKEKLLASQLLASEVNQLKEEAKVPALPLSSSWGQSPAPKPPTKTLLDIQREEAEEAEKARKVATAAAAAAVAANSNNNISSSIVNPALPSKNSFASIVNSASNNNPWTTVVSSKKPVVKQSTPKVTSTSNRLNPDQLRTVSASAIPVNTVSNGKSASPRQEFLTWCRSSMKLNKGVNINDVLQIMLMLPIGQESSEIIADTIYSNSSTMDGRRFAQEFMKRRAKVESQVNDGLSWNDALHITATDDDEGWDFQVVGKKNKRRN